MRKLTGDFETVTWLENETYVWAWAVCDIETEEIKIDNSIESFIDFCKEENMTIYFHNLKFDAEFIISWCLNNGFKHVRKKEEIEDNTFTTLINEMGQFYSVVIYFKKGNKSVKKVTFIDSLKILPFSVEQIAKSFDLPISKLKIDYNEYREKGHILTKEERDYIKNDVLIVAKALKILFDEELDRMTQGSNAVYDFKKTLTKSRLEHLFPKLDKDIDGDIRKSYKRGIYLFKPDL